VNEVSKHSQKLTYGKGSHFQMPGSDKYFYLVEKGRVVGENKGVLVQEVKENDWFGGREIFGLDPLVSELRALDEVVVYRIPEQILSTLLSEISHELFNASAQMSF